MAEKTLLSKFVLGTASFGNVYGVLNNKKLNSIHEIGQIIETFTNNGGSQLDTSSGYGEAEEIIGKLLKDFENKNILVNSKFILNQDNELESVKRQIDNSYKIFGNKLNSIICHTPDVFLLNKRDLVYSVFKYIQEKYSIDVGLSIYSMGELTSLDLKFKELIKYIQAPFNIFDSTAAKLKESNLLSLYTKVYARSIYLQGLLISEEILYKRFTKQMILFDKLCNNYKLSKKEVCIRFALQYNSLDFIVVGMNSIEHLNELISIMQNIYLKGEKEIIKNLENFNDDKYLTDPRKWKLINT